MTLIRTLAVTAVACAGASATAAVAEADAATGRERPPVVRKNAADMTPREIDRFKRAFSYAVRKGYFDAFSAEHHDQMRNNQHGADILAGAPPAAALGATPASGRRLLPWHRSFIIEGEQMLRAALRKRDRAEGRDPREAERVFMPYWNAASEQRLPRWVREFKPRGGTAPVPEGIPEGHAASGKPIGSSYDVDFGRWPATNLVFQKLPTAGQVARILAQPDFGSFLNGLDVVPEIVPAALPAGKAGLDTLKRKIPGDPNLRLVLAAMDPSYPKEPQPQLDAFNALMAVGHLANREAAKPAPDRELIEAIKAVIGVFRFPPHVVMHMYAGGLDPQNPDVRGTVTYFNELTVDPVFWMLHGELDRWWASWERSNTGAPSLTGADAAFQPLTRREGAWYGGGRRYDLADLTGQDAELPHRYDRTLRVRSAARAPERGPAPLTAAGFGCSLLT